MGLLRLILNVIWLVLCGWWMAILYFLAGLIAFILIITIPFGFAAWRIGGYVLWPFGRQIERRSLEHHGQFVAAELVEILRDLAARKLCRHVGA